MEPPQILSCQSSLEEKTTKLKLITCPNQSYSNQNSMVLIHKLMEQTRKPKNKPTYLWSINL